MGNKDWTDDGKPIWFEDLVDPVVEAIRYAYKLERQNDGQDIPWNGPSAARDELVSDMDHAVALTAKHLEFNLEDQGRDALVTLVSIAVKLGIEQGRRIVKNEFEYKLAKQIIKLYYAED